MKKIIPIIAVLLILLGGYVISLGGMPHTAEASGAGDLSGFAWTSGGWLSFNCQDVGSCGYGHDYKVTENADGTLHGYAWSSNIGWINFNAPGASIASYADCPSGGSCAIPTVDPSTGKLTGWVRACSAFSNKNACTGALDANANWDGWIRLGGTALDSSPYGPTQQADCTFSADFSSMGDLGWIKWAGPGYGVRSLGSGCNAVTGWVQATPSALSAAGNTVISWGSTYATSCTGTNFATGNAPSGSVTVPVSSNTIFSVHCTGPTGSADGSVLVTVNAPVSNLSISADPLAVPKGGSSTITWNATNASNCSLVGPSGVLSTNPSGSVSTGAINSASVFVLSCTSTVDGTPIGASATVRVTATVIEI